MRPRNVRPQAKGRGADVRVATRGEIVGSDADRRARGIPNPPVAMVGATKTAELQVNCALGAGPRERSVEGIRLTFEGSGNEFSEEVSGRVMFLAVRPEVKTQSKSPEPATGSAEPPGN
jgi:hypothetical protein